MSTIWIASYPKSGNTWLRFMLYTALYGPPENSIDIPKKIPDIHRPLPTNLNQNDTQYIKTHFELTNQHPQLNTTLKAIHIIRNPRDVLLSSLNYHRLNGITTTQLTSTNYAKTFIAQGGDPHYQQQNFGTWASHARSWRSTTHFPVHTLSYENLKANPEAELTRMLNFLEITKSPEEIKSAITASSFDMMRALEIREKKADKSNDLSKRLFVGSKNATQKGVYFMNQGKSNQSLDRLTPGLDEQFNNAFKNDLIEFGYEP